MKDTQGIAITGASGFIGKQLLLELMKIEPTTDFFCLVESRFLSGLEEYVKKHRSPTYKGNVFFLSCDITKENLGLNLQNQEELRFSVGRFIHLAAVYDLSVSYELAYQVNVVGTENVLSFINSFKNPVYLLYYSTCFVVGDYKGIFKESDLECGQGFKNQYEKTKHQAEVLVRQSIAKGLPASIIRPGIVCGDSNTGQTDKFDGLYFVMELLESFRRLPISVPRPGALKAPANFVPVDFLIKVTVDILLNKENWIAKTIQVTDPNPPVSRDVFNMLCQLVLGRGPRFYVPLWLLKLFFPILVFNSKNKAPREILDYFNKITRFNCSNLEKYLNESKIKFPLLLEGLPHLYRFWRKNRNVL